MELTKWHRLAYLYAHKGIELPEITKAMFIMANARFIDDDRPHPGYGIFNNKHLYQGLAFAMISGYPDDQTISQTEIAEAVNWSPATVSRTIRQMEKDGWIEYERKGAKYRVIDESRKVSLWVMEFGKALIELHFDAQIRKQLDEEYKKFWYASGFEVLWHELKELRQRKSRTIEDD